MGFRKTCAKGVLCKHCHFRHGGQRRKRIRPSKKTRTLLRANAESDEDESPDERDDFVLDRMQPVTPWNLAVGFTPGAGMQPFAPGKITFERNGAASLGGQQDFQPELPSTKTRL